MIIKTKMTQKEFIEANMVLRYSRIATKIITALGFVVLAAVVFIWLYVPGGNASYLFIYPLILLVLPAVTTWLQARSVFRTNARLRESLEYDFNDDFIAVKGESFSSQMTWEKFYRVKQTKNWIFIYQNRLLASPISKKDLFPSDIEKLKTILTGHKVKNNL
jgi:hypothetical protein